MAGYSKAWGIALLRRLGAPVNAENLKLLDAWSRAEGGRAKFNPLNTTQPAKGATNLNKVGVKNYPSEAVGLDATYRTLTNGRYGPILASLRAGRPAVETARKIAASPWGTGSGVSRVLGDKTPAPSKTAPASGSGVTTDAGAPGPTTATPAGFDLSNPLGSLFGDAISAGAQQFLTWALYAGMAFSGGALMLVGLVLLALATKGGRDVAEAGIVAAAPEAAPAVAAVRGQAPSSRSSTGSGSGTSSPATVRDENGLTPAQRAAAEHRTQAHADRVRLAEQSRADRLAASDAARAERAAREARARRERTRVRRERREDRERAYSVRAMTSALKVTGYVPGGRDWDEPAPAPKRRTAGNTLTDTPPY